METPPPSGRGANETVDVLLDGTLSDAERVERLLPLVYDQLRAVARRALAAERSEHTLQATALVHEAYVKLIGPRDAPWSSSREPERGDAE